MFVGLLRTTPLTPMATSQDRGSISRTEGFATSMEYPTSIPPLWAKPLDFVFLQSRPGAWAFGGTVNTTVSSPLHSFPHHFDFPPSLAANSVALVCSALPLFFHSFFFCCSSRTIPFRPFRSGYDADRKLFFFVPVFHNRNTQIAGSAPPLRQKPSSFKITFVKPIIKLLNGLLTPLG